VLLPLVVVVVVLVVVVVRVKSVVDSTSGYAVSITVRLDANAKDGCLH